MTLFSNLIHFILPMLPARELIQTLSWWAVLQIYAMAALPLTFLVFRNAPDRGWALSKSAGLLGVTYVSWLMVSAGLMTFTRLPLLLGALFLAFAGIALWVALSPKKMAWVLPFLRIRWRYILIVEIAFLYTLLFFANIRTYCPEAMYDPGRSGAEKFGNMTHLQSIYNTNYFPPDDCWFGGLPLNYYYMGHLQMASVGKMAGQGPEIAFNLGLATIVALTLLNTLGLTFWLTRRLGWALAAGWAVTVFGNLDGLQQFVINFGNEWRGLANQADGRFFVALNKAAFHPYFDFWRSSRIVEHTITEFPWFSAILGDLHPHHLSLSNWLLTLGVLLALWRSPGWAPWWRQVLANWPRLIVLMVLYGLCRPVNAWDQVTLMGAIIAILTARAAVNVRSNLGSAAWWFGGNVILLIPIIYAGGELFIRPFSAAFLAPMETGAGTFQPLPRYLRTWLSDYFVHFGLFVVPILIELGLLTRDVWREKVRLVNDRLERLPGGGGGGVILLILGIGFGAMMLSKALAGFLLPGFCLATMLLAVYLAIERGRRGGDPWLPVALTLFVFAQTVVLFVEFFFVNDRYAGTLERYNTLFKFWYPLWPVYGIVGGWAAVRLWARIPGRPRVPKRPATTIQSRWRRALTSVWDQIPAGGWGWRAAFIAGGVFIFAAGMTYPLASTANRTGIFNKNRAAQLSAIERAPGSQPDQRIAQLRQGMTRTLDARAYIAAEPGGLSDDFGIMQWLLQYENGTARILEANKHGSGYGAWGRMATMTGNKVLVGWGHHEHQWRPDDHFRQILNPNLIDIIKIYQTMNWEEAAALIAKHNFDYVMVGGLERQEYRPEQLKKFEDHLELAVQSGESRLYRVPRQASQP